MNQEEPVFHPTEGSTLPPEHLLGRMADQYIQEHGLQEVTDTAIVDLYKTYCDEHPNLPSEDKERIPLTIQTLLRLKLEKQS